MAVIDCGNVIRLHWHILQIGVCYQLHPYFDCFCTMQPFVLTCEWHQHFMRIDKLKLIQYVPFIFWIPSAYRIKAQRGLAVISKKVKAKKYQLPLSESLNRQYIQKVISLDYHIISYFPQSRTALEKDNCIIKIFQISVI